MEQGQGTSIAIMAAVSRYIKCSLWLNRIVYSDIGLVKRKARYTVVQSPARITCGFSRFFLPHQNYFLEKYINYGIDFMARFWQTFTLSVLFLDSFRGLGVRDVP